MSSDPAKLALRYANKPNTGHGHVFPREDGSKARCGGPGLCKDCAFEAAELATILPAMPNGPIDITTLFPPPGQPDGGRPDLEPYQVPKLDPDLLADYWFPVGPEQVTNLLGKMLTHLDAALGDIPAEQIRAHKSLLRQTLQGWYDSVKNDSVSSYRGCLAPIQRLPDRDGEARKYVWHAVGDHAVSVG